MGKTQSSTIANTSTANAPQPNNQRPNPTPTQKPEAQVTVTEVVVKGADGKLADLVKQTVKIRPGSVTTSSGLQEDINAIFATGYFRNVNAVQSDISKGVRVTFEVVVNPVLRRVEIKGNTLVPQKVITEAFASQSGNIINLRTLQEGVKKVNKWYQDNGYVLANFVDSPVIGEDGVVKLKVSEGIIEEIRVRFLNKEGQEQDENGKPIIGKIPTDIILKRVTSKVGQVFNRNPWEKDLQRVFALSLLEDVKISLDIGKDPKKVIVRLDVVEDEYASAFVKELQAKLAATRANKAKIEEAEILRWRGVRTASSKKEDKTAFDSFQAALKIFQAEKDLDSVAKTYNGIGNLYESQDNYEQAVTHYEKSIEIYQSQNNKLQVGIVSNNLGNIHIKKEKYDKAAESYDLAQKSFAEVKETFWQAFSLNKLAYSHFYADDKDKAVEYYSQAIAAWRNVKQPIANNPNSDNSLEKLAILNASFGGSTSKGIFFEASVKFDDRLVGHFGNKHFWRMITLLNLSNAFQSAGDYQQAAYTYNEVLEIQQDIKKYLPIVDLILKNNQNESTDSMNLIAKTVEFLFSGGVKFGVATLYSDLGNTEISYVYKQSAIKDFRKSLPALSTFIKELSKGKNSDIKDLVSATLPIAASLLSQQLSTDKLNYELFKDVDFASLFKELAQYINNGGEPPELAKIESIINPFAQYLNIYISNENASRRFGGNTQETIEIYQQNLVKLKSIKDQDLCFDKLFSLIDKDNNIQNLFKGAVKNICILSINSQQSKSLNGIAKIQIDIKQGTQAMQSLQQAISLVQADATKPMGNRQFSQQDIQKLVDVIFNIDKNQNISELNQLSASLGSVIDDMKIRDAKTTKAESLLLMGRAYSATKQYQEALASLNKSLALYQVVDNIFKQADARLEMAKVEQARGNLKQAKIEVETAITIIESERAQTSHKNAQSSSSKNNSNNKNNSNKITTPQNQKKASSYKAYLDLAKYLESKQNYYDFYIDLLMQLHNQQPNSGYDILAFQASEGSKSRSLRAIVSRSLNKNNQKNNQKNNKIEAQKQETNYVEIAKVPSLQEIQQKLLDDNTVLLEYALGEERSYLWLVTKNSIQTYQLPKRSHIDKLSRLFIGFLKSPGHYLGTPRSIKVEGNADVVQLPEIGNQLSDILLAPVADKLENKRLLIVSDGALQYVPFAALPKPVSKPKSTQNQEVKSEIKPLLVDHEIIGLPSASLQILAQEKHTKNPPNKTLAMLADPVFGRDDQRVKIPQSSPFKNTSLSKVPSWKRLEGTRKEALEISNFVPDAQKLVKYDFAANYSTATSPELSKYRFIHFATHGVFDAQRPERSGVIFSAVNEQGDLQRSLLSTSDVFKLNLSADLVVLSACTTALGQEIKGEGLIGLTGGLMYAGSKSVVSSFWDVDDAGTAELMSKFYANMLKEKQSPSQALRNSQLQMWQSSQWQAPYYWAAFGMQGK